MLLRSAAHVIGGSHNHFQLSRISQCILDDLVTRDEDVFALVIVFLLREVYPTVLDYPVTLFGEVDNAAFRLKK